MPRRKKEQIEHKSVSETQNQSETRATIKATEIDTTFAKQIHNAMTFPCPVCTAIFQMSNQIDISKKKGCKWKCVPFNFEVSTSTKSININKRDDGTIELDTDNHQVNFSWNPWIAPEDECHAQEVSKIVKEAMKRLKESRFY